MMMIITSTVISSAKVITDSARNGWMNLSTPLPFKVPPEVLNRFGNEIF